MNSAALFQALGWLRERLANRVADPPRFENSYYPIICGMLTTAFPVENGFLVKPQCILRDSVSNHRGHHPHTSVDSFGDEVLPEKTLYGRSIEAQLLIPDYIVAEFTSNLTNDTIVCLVEIKTSPDPEELPVYEKQVKGYQASMKTKRQSPIATTLLCTGGETSVWKRRPGPAKEWAKQAGAIETCGRPFWNILMDLASHA
ncbi:hypothetical protein CPB84DRAFT_326479 [Gymnopilus junonius]|uniref:Uncharacterized protein n=1 Tax=Gymnopilus junonius TaxID=109634 RepID=A0A9P5NCT7_GYMJU|nr:hypothetical protein CPB84DRAFT_326479 [Gymnopilus junonius]